jgi:hypothetical protein
MSRWLVDVYMVYQLSNKCLARSRRLIVLCCVLLCLTPANLPSRVPAFAATRAVAPTASPSPASRLDRNEKPPNPVRRFFSWIIQGISRPFRRRTAFRCQLPPMVSIQSSKSLTTLPCPHTDTAISSSNCHSDSEVTLLASATDPNNAQLLFTWSVTAGLIRGEGHRIIWDLSGVPVGTYTATVEVNDGNQLAAVSSTTVAVSNCKECERPPVACPVLTVSCPDDLETDKPITFEANVTGVEPETKTTITWSITAGKIASGQGTSKITVTASETERRGLTATAFLGDADPSCSTTTASCTIRIH